MKVIKNVHKVNAPAPHLPDSNYLIDRIGFWALVKEVNSLNNTVTVVSDTGFEYKNIPVKSDEWVTIDNNKDYIPSQRNLPPKNSRVFVLTPTRTATGAFVLCSGFSRGDENIRELWAKDKDELEDKNNCREIKTQGGWDVTEEYLNGNFRVSSNDEEIILEVNTTEDSDKSQSKIFSVTAWENVIEITEDGITITDCNDNKIEITEDGITVTDCNDNKTEYSSDGISINDKNNNKIELSNNGISINDKNNNKIELSNNGSKLTDKNNNKIETKQSEIEIEIYGGSKIKMESTKVSINNHLEVTI